MGLQPVYKTLKGRVTPVIQRTWANPAGALGGVGVLWFWVCSVTMVGWVFVPNPSLPSAFAMWPCRALEQVECVCQPHWSWARPYDLLWPTEHGWQWEWQLQTEALRSKGTPGSQRVQEKSRGKGELEPFNKAVNEVLDTSPSCACMTLTQNNILKALRTESQWCVSWGIF